MQYRGEIVNNRYSILGAPGTGKTTTLIARITKAVEEKIGEVMICSLTKTAAQEIADRVARALPGVQFDHVGTIHALALRALQADGGRIELVYSPKHIKEFNSTCSRRLPLELGSTMYSAADAGSGDLRILAEIDRRRALGESPEHWPLAVRMFYGQWSSWKASRGLLDFTDLIELAVKRCPRHPANPAYLFVDEAQDLSLLEVALVKSWSEGTLKTIIAGDDQQALYEWRGASVREFIEFAPPENRYVLPRGHRMWHEVHRTAHALGNRISLKIQKDVEAVYPGGWTRKLMMPYVADSICRDLEGGTVMLLASCGYILNPLLQQLRERGVPYHNPYRTRDEGRTWNPLIGKHADAFRAFLMPSRGQPAWTWRQLYKVLWPIKGLPAGLLDEVEANKASSDTVPPEFMRQFDLERFYRPAAAGDFMGYYNMILASVRSSSPAGYVARVLKNNGVNALDVTPRLIAGTIHSVKGGEADVAYVLPNFSPKAEIGLGRSAGKDSLLRTFYVGMSRPRRGLVMITAPGTRRAIQWP